MSATLHGYLSQFRCQHCGSMHPPAEWMYHKPECPHGKIDPLRLSLIPDWKLEEELVRRHATPTIHELLLGGRDEAVRQAATLSEALVILRELARLTRYARPTTTTLNVPSRLLVEIDRLLAVRCAVSPEEDHAD